MWWSCQTLCAAIIFMNLVFVSEAMAQLEQPARIEIPMYDSDDDFQVISAQERGIVLYREVRNNDTKMDRKYQIILVDSMLNVVWEAHYLISLRYILRGFEHFDNHFYLLFQRNTESLKADLFVLRIDLDTQIGETFLIEREFLMDLTVFEVVGNTIVLGGYSNSLPTVVCYEFGKNQPKVLPGFVSDRTELQKLEIDDERRLINVLVSFKTIDKRKSLSLKSFDETGELIKNINLQPSEERSLLFGETVKLDRDAELLVGTYTKKRSDMSRGIYIARISSDGGQIINYYNYADLKNFFNYMKVNRQKRIVERIERRKIKGKKNKFFYRLLVHEVVEWDGKYIMVGEAFYPKYSHSAYYGGLGGSYYGNAPGMAFEGYKYTHAVVFGFDRRGRLLWDNSFEISDVVSYTLDQYVHISLNDDELALIYLYENEIRTKVIVENEVVEGKTFNELKLSNEDDEVVSHVNGYGGLEKWYDGNLFVYGVQKIQNINDADVKLSRDVFFINKLRYR